MSNQMKHKNAAVKLLVVGQTPPPYMGQAMMIDRLVKAEFTKIKIYHVRMSFSDSFKSVGNFRFSKIVHLFEVLWKMLEIRFGQDVHILYYPPAGPSRTPVFRDIVLLGLSRIFFKNIIYHFRAAGISEFLDKQPTWFRKLAKTAYGRPDLSIQLSALNPSDGNYFGSEKVCIIANGLEDAALPYIPFERNTGDTVHILFVGVLRQDKGVDVLIEAANLLKEKRIRFKVTIVGEFVSTEYEEHVMKRIHGCNLEDYIELTGTLAGDAKWQQYMQAHVFCFPSYFESESFGNVLVEAMMFNLPVVSTYWRGIPDIVVNEETGFLTTIQSPEGVAEKLLVLIQEPALRKRMGEKGRQRYLEKFSLQTHLSAMEDALFSVTVPQAVVPNRVINEAPETVSIQAQSDILLSVGKPSEGLGSRNAS
jgi:glycosyltransferase involved in cell wall biosynthesis